MGKTREEIEKELIAASSVEEVKKIMESNGENLSDEEVKKLYDKVKAYDPDAVVELSTDELDAVAGGWAEDRDFLSEGCAATVEVGSNCWGTDMCSYFNVSYKRHPKKNKCEGCGYDYMCHLNKTTLVCPKCGHEQPRVFR